MLAVSHMVAGGAVGTGLRRYRGTAWFALPLALLSHYALDMVPHLDSHALFGSPTGGPTVAEVVMAGLDTLLGIALVLLLARRSPHRGFLLAGALLGIAPDLDNLPVLGAWLRAGPAAPLVAWHHAIQHNVNPAMWPLGIGTQVAVVALALILLLRARRPDRERLAKESALATRL